MSYSQDTYQKALAVISKRKQAAESAAEATKAAIYAQTPELAEIDAQIKRAAIDAAKAATSFDTQELLNAKTRFDSLSAERKQLTEAKGIAEFNIVYTCKKCNDSGFVDGLLCECAMEQARKIEYARLGKTMPLEQSSFDKFETRFYKDTKTRETMTNILNKCIDYATSFNPETSTNLLFLGQTGLGKTHLSLAIAGTAITKGYGVVYDSAQNLFSQIQKEHFGKSDSEVSTHVCECDLLIIDDLGAEFSNQFNQSALYNIINTRMQSGKPIIISTNLTVDDILEKYGQRIMSRIIGSFNCYHFIGKDVRQLKRMEQS